MIITKIVLNIFVQITQIYLYINDYPVLEAHVLFLLLCIPTHFTKKMSTFGFISDRKSTSLFLNYTQGRHKIIDLNNLSGEKIIVYSIHLYTVYIRVYIYNIADV